MNSTSNGMDESPSYDPENVTMDGVANGSLDYPGPDEMFPGIPSSTAGVSDQPSGAASAPAPVASTFPTRPQVDSQGRTLNPRSCVTCRKRKVKCDKIHPCSNCNRAHIECIYPSPGRAPRKARKIGEGRDKELMERLRRLEGVVKGMGVEVPYENSQSEATAGTQEKTSQVRNPEELSQGRHDDRDEATGIQLREATAEGCARENDRILNGRDTPPNATAGSAGNDLSENSRSVEEQTKGRFENRFGRLVVNEGRSRYVNNSFWASLSNEVEDLKGILNESSDEEADDASPSNVLGANSAHQGFVFGFSSQNVDLLSLHPLPNQIPTYWQTYKENVDPLCKVLHTPSTEPTILRAASHLSNLSKGFEPLMFSIYYGAVTSLSPDDCRTRFGEDKTILLARYRFGLEQALARANFLTTEEAVVLQAFVIFLICLRRNSDARVIWTLCGLVVRIAQTIGIHRDGSHFGLPPFEIEMRRRLWWQVCILDTRASEDHGCDPTIIEQSFDTKMPLNVNDVDLSPDMKALPKERKGCTDMTFCLIRFEVANTFRRINYIPPGPPRACGDFYASVSLADKERWITECHNRLEERYLARCDMSVPLYWVTATVARLMMSKMWLMVYHPFQRQDGGASLPEETRDKLFITSLENIEYSVLLETEARTMQWGWLFKTYMQWHALAFLLSELCVRTTGDLVERAWAAVAKTRDGRWGDHITDDTKAGHLWRPLKKLYRKAKEQRSRGLREEELAKQRTAGVPQRTYSPNANPMFGNPHRPTMVRAPLSSAQLQRFSGGPSYGDRPIDSHRLLRSPRTRATSLQELEVGDIAEVMQADGQRSNVVAAAVPVSGSARAPSFSSANGFAFDGVPNTVAEQPYSQRPTHFGQNLLNGIANIDFNTPPTSTTAPSTHSAYTGPNPALVTSTAQVQPHYPQPINATTSSAPFDLDLDAMEGINSNSNPGMEDLNLNWEGWDQLVRQFGMDVDGGPAGMVGAEGGYSGWDGTSGAVNGGGGSWGKMGGWEGF